MFCNIKTKLLHRLNFDDWLNAEHESTLTPYVPPAALESLLNCHIDTKLEWEIGISLILGIA
jgi:hypothetical protein